MKFNITKAFKEFVNTFEEWHYLIGGICIGYTAGIISGALIVICILKVLK